jgi:sirohydrochlorin cobaltochelatase
MNQGLLLFGHGSRDPAWADPFRRIAEHITAARPDLPVALGFLEFLPPDLSAAADTLVASGCASVHVVPMFLGTGGHVRRDLPRLVQQLRERHPGVIWVLRPPIGDHPDVVAAMSRAARDGLE